jgi:hypothetical protein
MRRIMRLVAVVTAAGLASCSPPTATPKATAPAITTPTFYVGDAVPARDVEIRVTKVEQRTAVGSEYARETAAEGGVLVVVRYSIKNTSDRPAKAYAAPELTLLDPQGVEYKPDAGKSGAYASELNLDQKLFSDLNPGITVKGATVFEVGKETFDLATWKLAAGGRHGQQIAMTEKPAAAAVTPPPISQPAKAPAAPLAAVEIAPAPRPETRPATRQATSQPEQAPAHRPDFSARERRLAGLIENAAIRDASGDVQNDAARARRERARCGSTACVERSYARQEASLRQWDGADEIR